MKEALAIRSSIECFTYVKSLTTAGSQMNSIRSVLCDRVWNWTVQNSITLLKVIEVQRDTDTHQTQTELSLNVGLLIKQADDNTFAHLSAVGEEIRTRDKWLCELPWPGRCEGSFQWSDVLCYYSVILCLPACSSLGWISECHEQDACNSLSPNEDLIFQSNGAEHPWGVVWSYGWIKVS